jgi:tetratricopeptide (TPR) repeat protein
LLNIEPSALSGHDEDAITDLLWGAFEKASQRWNPDQCPNELKELREGMVKIHTAMGEAFALLVDADRRAEAMATLGQAPTHSVLPKTMRSKSNAPSQDPHPAPPSSGERALEATRSAHELHALALTALAQQRADDALRMVRAACESEPDNPDYLASSVWIRASMERPDLKVLLLDLDDLLRHEPEHVTARYYRGVLRRRLGSDSSAQVDFERVLELDPGHAGARNQLAEVTKRGSRA